VGGLAGLGEGGDGFWERAIFQMKTAAEEKRDPEIWVELEGAYDLFARFAVLSGTVERPADIGVHDRREGVAFNGSLAFNAGFFVAA
jgi:hypothetical protein